MENDNLKMLHSQIDEDYAKALAQLNEERERRHRLLDELFAPWLRSAETMSAKLDVASVQQGSPWVIKTLPFSDDLDDDDFPTVDSMRGRIRSVIDEISEDVDIYLAKVYKMFVRKYPELMSEIKPSNLKAQISTVLTKLYGKKKLRLVKKGSGGIPNIYRKSKKVEVDAIDSENTKESNIVQASATL